MPVPRNRTVQALDLTYKLFLIAGLVTLTIFLVIALDPKNAAGWGMLLGPSAGLAGIVALLVGIVRGLWCWHHRPLLFLALSPILVLIGASISDHLGDITLVMCGAAMVLVPLWWFAKGKRRYEGNLLLAEQNAQPPSGFSE
jgi:hypothetical protein